MTPLGPRLIQPVQYTPCAASPRAPWTRPPSFGIVARRSSNGTPGSGDAAIADAAKDDAAGDHLSLAGRLRPDRAVGVGDEGVPDDLDRLDPAVAEDRDRRDAEAEHHRARLAGRRAGRVLPQHLEVAARDRRVLGQRCRAGRIELEVGGVDDDVRTGELAELLQLRVS